MTFVSVANYRFLQMPCRPVSFLGVSLLSDANYYFALHVENKSRTLPNAVS